MAQFKLSHYQGLSKPTVAGGEPGVPARLVGETPRPCSGQLMTTGVLGML
jgi:hypothetical protein